MASGGFGSWGQGAGPGGTGAGGFGGQQQGAPQTGAQQQGAFSFGSGQAGGGGAFGGFGANTGATGASAFGQAPAPAAASGFGTSFGGAGTQTPGGTGMGAFGQAATPAPSFGGFGATSTPGAQQGSSAPTFGVASAPAFGQPATPQPFGQAAPSATPFGLTTPTTSSFGQPPATATPGFGQGTTTTPGFGQGTTTTPGFGQGAATTPGFGQGASSTPGFGQAAATTSAFGQGAPTTPGFGQPSATPGLAFGQPAAQQSNPFGQQQPAQGTPFGQQQQQQQQQPTQTSAFGAAQPTQTSAFGATQPTQASSAFGAAPSTTSTGFGFGASTGAQATPGAGTTGGGFGGLGGGGTTGTSSLFGQPAQGAQQPASTTTGGFGFGAGTGGATGTGAATGGFGGFGAGATGGTLGGTTAPSTTPTTTPFGSLAQPTQPGATTNNGFGFGATAGQASSFGNLGAATSTSTAAAPGAAPSSTPSAFPSFGQASTPATTSTTTTTPSAGFSGFGAPAGGTGAAPQAAPSGLGSSFSFPPSAGTPAPAPAPATTPAFTFPSAGQPATGAPAPSSSLFPSTTPSTSAAPRAFSFAPAPAAAPGTSTAPTSTTTTTTTTTPAPAPAFSLGGLAAPSLSSTFGAPAPAPAPGGAPAPAPAPASALFANLGGLGGAQGATQPSTGLAQAKTVSFGGTTTGGFQLGGAAGGAGGGTSTALPGTTSASTASTAPGATATSGLFGGASSTDGPTGPPKPPGGVFGGGGGGGPPGGVFGGGGGGGDGPQVFGSRGRRQASHVKVQLAGLYKEPQYMNDREVREAFDQLALDSLQASDDGTQTQRLIDALGHPDFIQRATTFLAATPSEGYYKPRSDQSREQFKAFENKQLRLSLLPGLKEVDSLPGGKEEAEGVVCLAKFLQLEERKALHVMHGFQRELFLRGLASDVDVREYSSLYFYERVRKFYFNERVYLLQNIQEVLRISQDADYLSPGLRDRAIEVVNKLKPAPGALFSKLKASVAHLCSCPVPSVQDLNPQPDLRHRAGPEWWERQRRDYVEQGLVELEHVLSLFVLAQSTIVSVDLEQWLSLVSLFYDLNLGALGAAKQYMLPTGAGTAQRERRVASAMLLVLLQGMQFDLLQGSSMAEHPFLAGLKAATSRPLAPLLKNVLDGPPRSDGREAVHHLFTLLVLFWACFMHLTGPHKRELASLLHADWAMASDLVQKAYQKGAWVVLADMCRLLLDSPTPPTETMANSPPCYQQKDIWAKVGLQGTLRRLADEDGRPMDWDRADRDTLKYPMAEAVVGLLSACFDRDKPVRSVYGRDRLVNHTLEFFVFLTSKIFMGSPGLCDIFWKATDKHTTPLGLMSQQSSLNSPLLFFHLTCAAACDAATAVKATERLSKTPCVTAYDTDYMARNGNKVVTTHPYFQRDQGLCIAAGTQGEDQAPQGQQSRIMWHLSLWAGLVRQLEAFIRFVHEFKIASVVKRLDTMRDEMLRGQGNTLGWNTIIDKFPSLFVFGPVSPTTDDLMEEVKQRGAWPVMAFCLGRVEMILDQLALLVLLSSQDPTAARDLLSNLSTAPGVTQPNEPPLHRRLPYCLLLLVQAACDAIGGQANQQGQQAHALVTVQASALNLLEKLSRVSQSDEWRGEALRALVFEVEDRAPAVVAPRIPFIVWLGQRSIEHERSMSQYRIARDVVRLMQNLIRQYCDGSGWANKEALLPRDSSDAFLTRLVDFAASVLLTLDTWNFAKNLDRWMLALACVRALTSFLSSPFKSDDPASRALEAHRQSLLRRFRHDRVLFRALLRCAEHVPMAALKVALEARASRHGPFRFLDQLQPDHSDDDEREDDAGRGLFLCQEPLLPLRFDTGPAANAPPEERQLLDQLGVCSLSLLNLVLAQYVCDDEDTVAGALELLLKTVDLPLPKATRQAVSRRPLVSHVALLASLVSYPAARSARSSGPVLPELSLHTLSHLTKFMQALHSRKKAELEKAMVSWPPHLPLPFSPGVIEEMMSVTNARGFRKALFQTLTDWHTPPAVVMAGLNFLVDTLRHQPSLARHLLFSPRPAPSPAAPTADAAPKDDKSTIEGVIRRLLDRGKSLIDESSAEDDRYAWPFMACVVRCLQCMLRHVSWRRSLSLLASMDDSVWDHLHTALAVEPLNTRDNTIEAFYTRLAMLSTQRYALDTFAWVAAAASCKDEGPSAQVAKTRATHALKHLGRSQLLSSDRCLRQCLDSDFRALDMEAEQRNAFKWGLRGLDRFRLPDWAEQLKDPDPARLGQQAFVYDLTAVRRALHAGGEWGAKGRANSDVAKIETAVQTLNRRYSTAAAKHMVNKSFKSLIQIVVLRLGSGALGGLSTEALGRQVLLSLLDHFKPRTTLDELAAVQGTLDLDSLRINDPEFSEERQRQRGAERLGLLRRLRQPKLELLLTLLHVHGRALSADEAHRALAAIEQAFAQLSSEGVDPLSNETLQLDLRQCLLSSALAVLANPSLHAKGQESVARLAPSLLKHAVSCLALLDTTLIGETPASATFASERVESVLTASITLLGEMLPKGPPDATNDPSSSPSPPSDGVEERKGGDDGMGRGSLAEDGPLQRAEAEALLLTEFRAGQVMSRVLAHYRAASTRAAAAFEPLHDYTAAEAGRTQAVAELKADPSLARATRRLTCVMRFLLACASQSRALCEELVQAHVFHTLADDPLFHHLCAAIDGPQSHLLRELLYMRGYLADGEESPYYALWLNGVRLLAVLLHRLTRPHMDDGAALPDAADSRQLAALGQPTHDGREAKLLADLMALVGARRRLLLWPFGEGRVLTMALLREAEAVLVLVREMGLHMHTWRTHDLKGFDALRATVKSLVNRAILLLSRFVGADRGVATPIIEEDMFATVSKTEAREKKAYLERRAQNQPPQPDDPEARAEDSFVRILASAMGFLRYTGPLRLPRWIPLTPQEAERTSFAEGTNVLYLDTLGMTRSEGRILERRLEYRYQEEHLVGTYSIEPSHSRGQAEVGVAPRRILAVEDNDYLGRASADAEFELELGTHMAANPTKLSIASLVTLAKFCLQGLDTLGAADDGRTPEQKSQRGAYLERVLEHTVFLLVQVTPGMYHARPNRKDRQALLGTLADVLDDVVKWRWPGAGSAEGRKEGAESEEELNQRWLDDLKAKLRDHGHKCESKARLSDKEEEALANDLVLCGKHTETVELGYRCFKLRRHMEDSVSLRSYAAFLHAMVEAHNYVEAVKIVEQMIKDSLTRLAREVARR